VRKKERDYIVEFAIGFLNPKNSFMAFFTLLNYENEKLPFKITCKLKKNCVKFQINIHL